MSKAAKIKNGVVENVIVIGDETIEGFIDCPDEVGVGWTHDGVDFIAPAIVPVQLTAEERLKNIENAVQSKLDSEARLAGYDSIHTAVTYAGETSVAKFSDDGKSFRKWRSKVWEYCYGVLADYQAGNISEPTLEEMIAGMPARA